MPWLKVGMALQAVSKDLLDVWIEFSRQSDKFQEGECERQWRGFQPDKAQSLGVGSLIRWAREDSGDDSFGKGAPTWDIPTTFASVEEAAGTLAGFAGGLPGGLWKYTDAQAAFAFAVARINMPGEDARGKPKKTFRPIRRVGQRYEAGDPPGPLPLYRLHGMPTEGVITLVEGEKAADAGAELGLATTTSAHGANAAAKSDWSVLAGRDVRILPDNDPEGFSYAIKAGGILEKLSPPARVKVLTLPDLPPRGDIYDFIKVRREAGRTDAEIRDEIEALSVNAPTLASFAGGSPGASPDFPDPVPLPDERPPVPAFDYDLLPATLQPWLRDVALRMQCAADFLFAAVMVALATVIGRRIGIRPKRYDTWLVVVNLWGGAIGRPGILKTPAVQEALRPLHKLEAEYRAAFKDAERGFQAAVLKAKAKQHALERKLRKAVEDGGGDEIAEEMLASDPETPTRRRLIVNDTTVEKLGEILAENSNGVLAYRDELLGLLRSLDKEGQESARAFYLQAWNGDSSYTYDRILRGTVEVEHAIVSVFGSIQPGPLRDYVVGAAANGKTDDGLLQRFQLLVYPDQDKAWVNCDQPPDEPAREAALAVFQRLDKITGLSEDAELDFQNSDAIPYLHFDDAAQARFDHWREELERRLRSGEEEEIFESHLAKFRSLLPSLALIYHVVDVGRGPVQLVSLERAIRACKYLEGHARRVYAGALNPQLAAAHALAKRMLARKVQSPFTLRDVYQRGWSLLTNATEVGNAVEELLDYDWLVETKSKGDTGAPKTSYLINPKIWKGAQEGTGKTPKTPTGSSGISHKPTEGTGKTGRTPESGARTPESPGGGTSKTGRSPGATEAEGKAGAGTSTTGKTPASGSGGLAGTPRDWFEDDAGFDRGVHDA